MDHFIDAQEEETAESITNLVENLLGMEEMGNLTDEETDICLEYLQKIVKITGTTVDFDQYYESET